MASVGSVEIGLSLDTTSFDRQLSTLESRSLKPLALELKLDRTAFERSLSTLTKQSRDIQIRARLDTTAVARELRSLTQTQVLEVKAELDTGAFRSSLRSLTNSASVLNIAASLDSSSIRRDLRKLTQEKNITVKAELDTTALKMGLRSLEQLSGAVSIKTELDSTNFQRDLGRLAAAAPHLTVKASLDAVAIREELRSFTSIPAALTIAADLDSSNVARELLKLTQSTQPLDINIRATLNTSGIDGALGELEARQLKAIALEVNGKFDKIEKQLRSIETRELTPLNLGVRVDTKSIEGQIRGLVEGDYGFIPIALTPDIKGFSRALKDLPKSLVDDVKVRVEPDLAGFKEKLGAIADTEIECLDICLDPDIEGFRKKLEALYNLDIDCLPVDICLDTEKFRSKLKDIANAEVEVRANARLSTQEALGQLDALQSRAEQPLNLKVNVKPISATLASLIGLITTPLNAVAELIASPFKAVSKSIQSIFAGLTGLITTPLKSLATSLATLFQFNITPKLDTGELQGKLRAKAARIELDCIPVEICIDSEQLRNLALQSVKYNPLTINLTPNFAEFDRRVKSGLAANSSSYSTDVGLNTDSFKANIKGAFTDALKQVEGDGIFKGLGALVFGPLKLAAAAIAPIFLGLGAAIGLPLGQQIGTGLAKGLQLKLGNVLGSFELVGDTAGRLIGSGVESGFGNILSTTKANAEAIVNILEKTVNKKKLTEIFGANYRTAIKDAIENIAPGKAITQALGKTEVLIESRSQRGADNQTKLKRRQSASSQLEVERQAASAILSGLQKSAAEFDATVTSFLEEYRTKSSSLTQQEIRQFEQTAKTIEQRKKALQKQTSEVNARLKTADVGLQTLGVAKGKTTVPTAVPELPSLYTDLVKEVTARSGIDKLPKNLIPKLNVDQNLKPGKLGTYDPKLNQINVSKEAQEALKAAKVDFQTIETLVHELRHAVQLGFGQIDVAATGKTGVQLERATPEEISKIGTRIESSVESQPKKLQEVARGLETDAYVFAERNTKDIQQRLGKRNTTRQFESELGLGAAKVDLQLKRAQTQELKKIQKISALAASYGIDLQKEAIAALAAFSQSDTAIGPLLEKARNLDILSVDEIQDLQQRIQENVNEALADIGRQAEIVKNALVAKTESGKETSSTSVTEKEQRTKPTDTRIVASAPNPELETRANQLTRKQLNPVAEKLNISSRGKKTQDLRSEILKSNSSELQKALPTVISEISASIKAEADALSKVSVEELKARGKEIHTILKQAQAESENLGGIDKSNSLKEILDAIESEQQLLKETLTRELEDDARNLLRSQQANLGKPRRKAQTEFGQLKALQSQTTRVSANKSGVQKLSQSGGNSFDSLASFEDVSKALNEARLSLFNTFNKSTAAKIRRTPKISSTPTNQKLDLTNSGIDKEFTDLKKEQQKHTAEINLELKTLQEQETVRRSELEAELQRLKTQSSALKSKGLGFKSIRKRAAAGENTDIQGLQNSLQGLDALIGQIDKKQNQQMSSVVDQAKRDLATLKQLNAGASRRVRRSTKSADAGIKGVEAETEQELSRIETDRVRKQQRLDNRLQRRYGLTPSVAPGAAIQEPTKVSDELKSVGKEIGGLFKGIQTARFDAAKKQAQALGQQARTILADIEAQITIGKGAEQQARIANADVKRNELAINKILQAVRRSESGQGPKFDEGQLRELSEQVNELSAQIDKDQGRLAALNQQATKGRELQPQADRLRSGIAGADREIGSDAPSLRRLQESNTEVRTTLSALGTPAVSNPFNSLGDAIAELDGGIGKLIGGAGTLLKGFLAFRAVSFLQGVLQKISVEAFNAFLEFDRLRTALNFGSGGTAAGAKNLAFVRAEVDRLRIPLGAAIKGFANLSAATKGTALEGAATRSLSRGVGSASSVLGLSAENTSGLFTALTQSASRGKVQFEEILQLSESGGLSGATSIVARSLGVTTEELGRLSAAGQLLSEDVLPRLGQQLEAEFGGSAEEASKNAQSAVFAFQNAFLSLQQGIGEGIAPAVTTGLNALTVALKFLGDNAGSVAAAVASVSAVIIAQLLPSLAAAGVTLLNLIKALPLFSGGMGVAAKSVALFSLQAGAIFLVIEAIRAVSSVVNDELAVSYEKAARRAKELADASSGIKTPEKPERRTLLSNIGRSLTFQPAQEIYREVIAKPNRINRFKESVPEQERQTDRLLTSGSDRLQTLQTRTGDGKNFFDTNDQLRAAEGQRKILQGIASRDYTLKGLAIPANLNKDIAGITLKINELNQKRIEVAKPFNDDLSAANEIINSTKARLESLNDSDPEKRQEEEDKIGGKAVADKERARLERLLDRYRTFKANLESEIARTNIDPILGLATAFDEIKRKLEEAERAAKIFATTAKTAAIRTQIATFATDPDAARKSAAAQAQAEIEATKQSIASRRRLLEEAQSRLNAPEVQPTLKKLNINENSSIADIDRAAAQLDKNDKASEQDKKVLQDQKAFIQARADLAESSTALENQEAQEQIRREQDALAILQRTSADGQAIVQRAEAAKLAAIKQRQLGGKLTEEQAAAETARIQLDSTRQNQQNNASELATLKDRHAQGIVGAEAFHDKERELINQSSSLRQQAAEQELAVRQAVNAKVLAGLELANQKAIALIDEFQGRADIGTKQRQLASPSNEVTSRAADSEIAVSQSEATARRVAQAQTELAQLDRKNFLNSADFDRKRIELNQKLGGLVKQQLDEQLGLQKRNQDDAIFTLQRRSQLEKDRGELTIQNLEEEKGAIESFNSSLDRTKKLTESRGNLSKALSSASIAVDESEVAVLDKAIEIRPKLLDPEISPGYKNAISDALGKLGVSPGSSELDILNRRQQIEDNIASAKQVAQEAELRLAQELLRIDLQREQISAQSAVLEKKTAKEQAILARVQAQAALKEANRREDPELIESAQLRLEISDKIVASAGLQVENAISNLNIQDDLAFNALASLNAQQKSVKIQAESVNRLREVNQDLTKAETQFKPLTATPTRTETNNSESTGKRSPRFSSMLDRSLGLAPGESMLSKALGLAPGESMLGRALNQLPEIRGQNTSKIDPGIRGFNKDTSAEGEFNRSLGLAPLPSTIPLQPLQSSAPLGSPLAANNTPTSPIDVLRDSIVNAVNGASQHLVTIQGLLQEGFKLSPKEPLPLQGNPTPTTGFKATAFMPSDNASVKGLREVTQMPVTASQPSSGFRDFVSGLKEANRGLESRLDKLIDAQNRPNLYVSSPTPVSDASKIWSDITYQSVVNSGLA